MTDYRAKLRAHLARGCTVPGARDLVAFQLECAARRDAERQRYTNREGNRMTTPPLIQGGQGRDAEDVQASAGAIGWAIIGCGLLWWGLWLLWGCV